MKHKPSLLKYCGAMKRRLGRIKRDIEKDVGVEGMRIRQLEASLEELSELCAIVEELWKKRNGKR